jgi:hypothetical protein
MQHTIRIYSLLFLALSAVSCSRTFYPTDQALVPPIQKPGDFTVTGDMYNSGFGGYGVAVAGSPAQHTALFFRHSQLRGSEINPGFFDEYRVGAARYTEGGAGTYFPVSERNTASLYVGYGQGNTSNEYQEAILATLQYRRLYIQPGMYTEGRRMTLSSAVRLIRLQHFSGNIDARIPIDDLRVIQDIERKTPHWIAEFGFTAGFRFTGFQINAFLTQTTPGNPDLLFADSAIGLSATLLLHEIFRRSK